MQIRSSWLTLLAAGALALPLAASAQDVPAGQPATHTVRRGDTLWDLARQYLGDPFQWPEIFRINTDVVEDPHWIYPGEVLRIPGRTPVVPAAAGEDPMPAPPQAFTGPTVFSGPGRTAAMRAQIRRLGPPAVREGEFHAAPWLDDATGIPATARLVGLADIPGVRIAAERGLLQLNDRLYMVNNDGSTPDMETRYLVFTTGPVLGTFGRVMIPTGVLEVDRAAPGEAAVVRLVQLFGDVRSNHHVMPLAELQLPAGAAPAAIEGGVSSHVLWMLDNPVLPTVQQYLVLPAEGRDGVALGDQFTLFRPREERPDGVIIPEEAIAVAQVVRVTPQGITVIVIDQTHPAIGKGVSARLTAKMP